MMEQAAASQLLSTLKVHNRPFPDGAQAVDSLEHTRIRAAQTQGVGTRRTGLIPQSATVAAALAFNAGCGRTVQAMARRFNIGSNGVGVRNLADRLAAWIWDGHAWIWEGGDGGSSAAACSSPPLPPTPHLHHSHLHPRQPPPPASPRPRARCSVRLECCGVICGAQPRHRPRPPSGNRQGNGGLIRKHGRMKLSIASIALSGSVIWSSTERSRDAHHGHKQTC